MPPIYEHRQPGKAIVTLILLPLIPFSIAIALVARRETLLPLSILLAFMLLTAWIFSSLTIRVDAQEVQFFFGPGVFRRRIPLDSISGVRVVRNAAWMGLGIHFIRGGLIYNVSGLDGIEIDLAGGKRVRVGSDEPEAAAAAIQEALARAGGRA